MTRELANNHRSPSATTSRRLSPRAHALGVGLVTAMVVSSACKKDEPAEASAEPAQAAKAEPAPGEAAGAPASTPTPVMPATRLQRGQVLAHVLIAKPGDLLGKISSQLRLPMVSEAALRGQLAAQLGKRAAVAQGLDLTRPLGCAMVEVESWSCVLGYKDGADKLVTDLGDEGKQADAAGHAAHYKIDRQDLYIDPLGDAVAVSTRPDAFAATKDYLGSNLVGRASKVASDIEAVAYLAEGMKKYESDLKPILEMASQTPPAQPSGNPKLDKVLETWNAYGQKTNREQLERFAEMQQISIGIGLESAGLVGRAVVFATEGSRLQKESRAQVAALDTTLLSQLPASSWLVFGSAEDRSKTWNTQTSKELREMVAQSYADVVGKDKAETEAALAKFMEEHAKLYTHDSVMAIAHEPDTLGGVVVAQPLRGGSARDAWKTWSAIFTPENVLDDDARKLVTWSFEADVATVDSVPVDRWTIEPGPQAKAEFDKQADATARALVEKLGGLRLVIDRAEVAGKAVYVFAPKAEQVYMKAAIAALKGQQSLAGNAGLQNATARAQPGTSGLGAADVKRGLAWVRNVFPAQQTQLIPPNLGGDLGDVYLWWSFTDAGATTGELVISQSLVDQLRALVPI